MNTPSTDLIRANLAAVREEIAAAGRDPSEVQVLAAVKYLDVDQVGLLHAAGITLAGENRAQALLSKAAAHPQLTWDFIGSLQSRKVRDVVPLVRYIHSVATDSALAQLARHGTAATQVLVEVNIAAEPGKSGIAPEQVGEFIARCPVTVVGLMTMPPLARRPQDSRRWFAALAALAREHGLAELSMGTTQDFAVAASEGATIVRIGTRLYA